MTQLKQIRFLVAMLFLMWFGNILYAQTGPYEDLLDHRTGFAQTVSGGKGGEVIEITAIGAEGYTQLRSAVNSDSPKWIRFSPGLSGSIMINGTMNIGSNTTIDGRGANITLEGKNLADQIFVWGDTNVIVHNIRIYRMGHADDEGQAFGLARGADNIWLDHVTFEHNGDESLSFGWDDKDYTYRVTASYCYWYNTVKCILAGGNSEEGKNIKLTVHHSAFVGGPDVGVSRIPLLRRGKIHFYNNFVKDIGWQAAAIHEGAQALLEYNLYNTDADDVMNTGTDQWDPEPGWICDIGNVLRGDGYRTGPDSCYDCSKVFKASDYYEYELDSIVDDMKSVALLYAGRSDEPQWVLGSSPKPNELILEIAGTGEVIILPERDHFFDNEVLTLTAETSLGNDFSHWSGDLSGTDNPATVIMDTSKKISANFVTVPVYRLTTATLGNGHVSSKANGDYNKGTEVKVIAFPDWQEVFLRWEGDLSGNENPITIAIDSVMSIIAVFSGETAVINNKVGDSSEYELLCYPNPFKESLRISYELKQDAAVKLQILNLRGQVLAVLVNRYQMPGTYNVQWNRTKGTGHDISGSMFIATLEVDNSVVASQFILSR